MNSNTTLVKVKFGNGDGETTFVLPFKYNTC